MTINGVGGTSGYSPSGAAGKSRETVEDPRIASLKEQITKKEQALKEIAADKTMSDKEKTNEKKRIQDEINELNRQVTELQQQIEKEEQEKKAEATEKQEDTQKTDKQKEIEEKAVPEDLIQSMTTAQTALSESGTMDVIKTKLEGEARVARSEAKMSAKYNMDASYSEQVAADAEAAAQKTEGKQLQQLGKAVHKMKDTAEEAVDEKKAATDTDTETETEEANIQGTGQVPNQAEKVTYKDTEKTEATEQDASEEQKYLENVKYKEIDVLI